MTETWKYKELQLPVPEYPEPPKKEVVKTKEIDYNVNSNEVDFIINKEESE